MKQHITPKQLNELSKKGKERLRKWWIKRYLRNEKKLMVALFGKKALKKDNGVPDNYDEVMAFGEYEERGKFLSIGQCIEFLGETEEEFEIYHAAQDEDYFLSYIHDGKGNWENEYDKKELIDCLWEAVKEVLEK